MRSSLAVLLAASVLVSSAVEAKKPAPVSPLALQQIQARDYEVTKEVSFPSVMTILQDSGYRIQAADKDTGLITATASTKSKLTWAPFVGFGRSKKTPVVSAYIEDRGSGSRIRLSFVMAKVKANAYGTSLSDEEPITDPATYRDAFERIEKEIFVRQAMVVPTGPTVRPASSAFPQPQPAIQSAETTAPHAAQVTAVPSVVAAPSNQVPTPATEPQTQSTNEPK